MSGAPAGHAAVPKAPLPERPPIRRGRRAAALTGEGCGRHSRPARQKYGGLMSLPFRIDALGRTYGVAAKYPKEWEESEWQKQGQRQKTVLKSMLYR